jgi:hypothetical protein
MLSPEEVLKTAAALDVLGYDKKISDIADKRITFVGAGGSKVRRVNGISPDDYGDITIPGAGGSITIQEQDGTPSGTVSTLKVTNGTLTNEGSGVFSLETGSGGGGATLAAQYHRTDYGATTTYSGVATQAEFDADTWTIVRKVLSGNNRETVTISTATDQWANRATASYTTSLTYSN